MNIEDLRHIFKPQMDQIQGGDVKLFYMLVDGDHKLIDRHSANDLENLLTTLDSFQYNGSENGIPRFVK
jgi:hypothetical protein